jgi:peptide chain release factor 1
VFSKLDDLERKFEDLSHRITDPSVIQNNTLYQKLTRERAGLIPLVETYGRYKKTLQELDGNKHLLNESDEEIRKMAKDEIARLEPEKERLEQELKILLLPKDPNDEKNIFLEIRAGTGGDEAALFASDLFRMYQRYADTKGWRVEIMDSNPSDLGGFKEIIAQISGDNVYSGLKYEAGTHRVQRVPKTEQQGRIHTSAVTVAVIPEAEDVDVQVNESDIQTDVFRASGPGGQGVNTTDSAVRLTHKPSGLVVVCRDERSQIKNKAKAMKILKSRLYEIELEKRDAVERATRKAMVGSGDRSEKIRTYNFPQNRMTDHRIGLTLHQLDAVMDGKIEEVISALRTHYQTEALKASMHE